jgi:LysM repeat protein
MCCKNLASRLGQSAKQHIKIMAIIPEDPSPDNKPLKQTKIFQIISKIKNQILSKNVRFLAVTGSLLRLVHFESEVANMDVLETSAPKFNFGKAKNFLVGKLPHAIILFLTLIVAIANISEKISIASLYSNLIYVDPDSERQIAGDIDRFTQLIQTDDALVAKAASTSISPEGFALNVGVVETQITAREEPLPDNSKATVSYRVRNGDTLTQIGWKFDVKLATLKYVNDLDNIDTIRPGITLKIPPKGYIVSTAEIARKEKEKQTKLAMQRSTFTRNASVARAAAGNDNYDGNLIVPINYKYISQGFSSRHSGIDYVASIGTAVMAAGNGTVIQVESGWSGGYGLNILVSHGSGVVTRYAHLSSVKVSAGDHVSQGQVIARSGSSGRSTGPHLHFERIVNGRAVSPF